MKKLFVFLVIFLSASLIFANNASGEEAAVDSEWNDMLKFDRDWRTHHEAVTDEEFEKVMQRFEKKKKPKKYEFEADEKRDSLNDMSILNEIANHTPTILFPADLRSYEGEKIPAGYYTLHYVEKNKTPYIVVTQGRKIYAQLEMSKTDENFGIESIQFAEIRPYNNEMMKLIYGNLDLNLEKNLYILY